MSVTERVAPLALTCAALSLVWAGSSYYEAMQLDHLASLATANDMLRVALGPALADSVRLHARAKVLLGTALVALILAVIQHVARKRAT